MDLQGAAEVLRRSARYDEARATLQLLEAVEVAGRAESMRASAEAELGKIKKDVASAVSDLENARNDLFIVRGNIDEDQKAHLRDMSLKSQAAQSELENKLAEVTKIANAEVRALNTKIEQLNEDIRKLEVDREQLRKSVVELQDKYNSFLELAKSGKN